MDEFEALLASGITAVERWLNARIGNRADAEDVLQETCLAAYQGFAGLKDKKSFLPWILGIARRKCADWYRAHAKDQTILMGDPPDRAESFSEDSLVEETLLSLPEKDRTMLRLFYQERMSQREISDRLHIPEGTVKSRMNAARTRFRAAYPYPPKGGIIMERAKKLSLPEFLPDYTIDWKEEPPFTVMCEELSGWFVVPHLGEKLVWGMYDLPSRKLDVSYEMTVIGPASVHGLDGVAIRATVLPPQTLIAAGQPIKDAVEASTGGQEEWTFIAQEKDGFTRFLSAEHVEEGVRTLTTFLDGKDFMDNWGFGEDNCGTPVNRRMEGKIMRRGTAVTTASEGAYMDIVGRCDVKMSGKVYDTVCLMDLGLYEEGMVSEQYLDQDGRTVLWRRFNQDDWDIDRYGRRWSELLPDNERITVNGKLYVHWYDCICLR
ncbi:MAG: sigma-70 family RNA polymerase sigma factor [Clostridia bacterium]|nr:sigma-70 family RNA polymerase sigma factor [Clostridia bacterium]